MRRTSILWAGLTVIVTATTRISVTSAGAQATGGSSYQAAISANARVIAFASDATNLVPGDTNGQTDAFLRDRTTGSTVRASVKSGGVQVSATGYVGLSASLSADGSRVAFSSSATNLVPGDTNAVQDIFIRDVPANTTTRLTMNDDGMQAMGGHSLAPSLSADGRFVAFSSAATNLVYGDTNGQVDIFVRDNRKYQRRRVSVSSQGTQLATGHELRLAER